MTNDSEKIISIGKGQNRMSKYELLKTLMNCKESTETENKALSPGILLVSIGLVVIAGLYWRTQLGHRPTSVEEVLTQVQCPVVGNSDSKLYHLPRNSYYLELLQGNKARENRICFHQEWEAWLAGYKKSKF